MTIIACWVISAVTFPALNLPVKLLLLKALIRPKLEHASSVWDPAHDILTHSIELVQNNSTRFILFHNRHNRTATTSTAKSRLDLSSSASRIKICRLALFHKLFCRPIPPSELILEPPYRTHIELIASTKLVWVVVTQTFFQ